MTPVLTTAEFILYPLFRFFVLFMVTKGENTHTFYKYAIPTKWHLS